MTVASPEFSAGVSSPVVRSSAESNFRELDDAFLQTQTRIWLGEVLQMRFDEETNICDVLSDGELLFELSEVLSRMAPSLPVDVTQSKSNESKSLASNKSTRRYMPYYNVGSFLKMCMNLGLNGIDLFSPSDVVEKRNTRKVCMCIRSLSKKARSRDLNVPDFDSVTCTLSMPTNMVECIRKSLEMSQLSSSLSVGDEIEASSGTRYSKRTSDPASVVSDRCSSDICDDADSGFVVGESNKSSDTCDVKSPDMSYLKAVRDYSFAVNVRGLENEEDDQCEYLSPSIAESVGSPCSQYFSDQEAIMPSSDCFGSHISGKVKLTNEAEAESVQGDLLQVPIGWGVSASTLGDPDDDCESIEEIDCKSQGAEVIDIACITGGSPAADNVHGSNVEHLTDPPEVECEKRLCSEQVSCTNISSSDGRGISRVNEYVLDADEFQMAVIKNPHVHGDGLGTSLVKCASFHGDNNGNICNELQAQRSSDVSGLTDNTDCSSCNGVNHVSQQCTDPSLVHSTLEGCRLAEQSAVESNGVDNNMSAPQSILQSESFGQLLAISDAPASGEIDFSLARNEKEVSGASMITPDHIEEQSHDFTEVDANLPPMYSNASVNFNLLDDNGKCSEDENSCVSEVSESINVDDAVLVNSSSLIDALLEAESTVNVGSIGLTHQQFADDIKKITQEKSEHTKQSESKEVQHKSRRNLLKSVVKGTAIVGIAVFLLHLRRTRQENVSNSRKQPVEVLKWSAPTASSKKGQKGGNTSSVYPAEKLKFGI